MSNAPPAESHEPDAKVRRIELLISHILRGGVILSFCVVLLGMVLTFVHHPGYLHSTGPLDFLTNPQRAEFPHTLPETLQGLRAFHGQAVVLLGLVLLIATPVLRVAISIFGFIYQKDKVFVAITTVVLVLLLVSFVLGKVE